MAINLMQKLRGIAMTEFEFTAFHKKVTVDDVTGVQKEYLMFELADVMPSVIGSQKLYHPTDRSKAPLLTAFDVTEVEVFFDVIEEFESEFSFDHEGDGDAAKLTGSGKYKGNLRLDVSQNNRVWLVKESFAKKSSEWKNKNGSARVDEIIAKQLERAKLQK